MLYWAPVQCFESASLTVSPAPQNGHGLSSICAPITSEAYGFGGRSRSAARYQYGIAKIGLPGITSSYRLVVGVDARPIIPAVAYAKQVESLGLLEVAHSARPR